MATFALLVVAGLYLGNTEASLQKLSTANSDFAFDLYKEIASKSPGENLFFSPTSVSTAMAMVHAGAKGNTKDEMASVLKFGSLSGDEELNDAFKELLDDLNSPGGAFNLSVTNSIFSRLGYNFRAEFLKLTDEKYSASVEELDFQNDPSGATDYINDWVKAQTNGKIEDLIPEQAILPTTAMVLVNTIYFRGYWQSPFMEEDTTSREFFVSKDKTVMMDTMYQKKYHKYTTIADWKCRMLELPYKDFGEVSYFILLPDEIDGLGYLEERVNIEGIDQAISNLTQLQVKVRLPKMKLTFEANMKKLFQDMGISDLFEAEIADLSAMNGARECHISEIVHKAFLNVNEIGTEAAAATAIGVGSGFGPDLWFDVNRPSLFFIKDRSSGAILFMGRLVKPPGDGTTIGAFGQGDDKTSAANNIITSAVFSVVCVLMATIYTI